MMEFDKRETAAVKIPKAIRNALLSIYVKEDEEGNKTGMIPPGEEARLIAMGEKMVREKNLSVPEAVNRISTATLDKMEEAQGKQMAVDEAKAAIPGSGGWTGPAKEDVDAAKIAVENALNVGIPREEIETLLTGQGWKENVIPNLFPEGQKKPMVAQAPAAVPRETAGAPKTLRQVKEAWLNGDYGDPNSPEAREQAKKLMNQIGKA